MEYAYVPAETTESSSSEVGMSMTFLPWGEYRGVKILFDFWEIRSTLSLCLSCSLLFLLSVSNSWIRSRMYDLEKEHGLSHSPTSMSRVRAGWSDVQIRIALALLSAAHYGVGLLLMLAAMTFQPWLFVSIVAG